MNKVDIDRAVEAYRWSCPNSVICRKLDGTKEPDVAG